MRRALGEYHVGGIRTNLPFHRQVMRHPAFIAGDYDTGFIERHKAELAPAAADDETAMLAAVAAAAHAAGEAAATTRDAGPVEDAAVGVEERPQGLTAAAAAPTPAPRRRRRCCWSRSRRVYVVWGSTYLAIRIARRALAAAVARGGALRDRGRRALRGAARCAARPRPAGAPGWRRRWSVG